MQELKILPNVDGVLSFNLNPCLNILGLNPEKVRVDIMRRIGHETVTHRIKGGVLWRQ